MAPSKRLGIIASDYGLYDDRIRDDLTKELPQWILSAYGPGRAAVIPRQLFGGLPRELSFEELRLRQYEFVASGSQQQAFQVEQDLLREADGQNKQVLRQIGNAISYIIDGANEHPNRIDIAKASIVGERQGESAGWQSSNPFGSAALFQSMQTQNARPSGQPAGFATNGSTDISMNTPATPIFSQNAFSKGLGPSSFGQVSQAQPSNGFARPLQPSSALNPLGGPTQTPSFFGQPGQATGTPSAFSINAQVTSTLNPFQTSQPAPSAFNVAPQQAPAPSPFSKFTPSNNATTGGAVSGDTISTTLPASSDVVPLGQTLRKWKGKPVVYEDKEPYIKLPEGKLARIWFPHGPPELTNEEGVGSEDDVALKEQYLKAEEMGTFGECQVPEVAPRMEWVRWDL